MKHYRIAADSGVLKGTEFPIDPSGLNIGPFGPTDKDPIFRIEIRGDQAVLLHFAGGQCDQTEVLVDGSEFDCGEVRYSFWSRRGRTPEKLLEAMASWDRKPHSVSIGCPDEVTETVHDSILDFLKSGFQNKKRAAVLLDSKTVDGMMAGTYSPDVFPVDSSAIEAVQDDAAPLFMNDARTVCCVALPLPDGEYLYVEAEESAPFHPMQRNVLAGVASLAIGLHDVFANPDREKKPKDHQIAVSHGPMKGAILRIPEPGCAVAPYVSVVLKHDAVITNDRRPDFAARLRTVEDLTIPSADASLLKKPLEVLRIVLDLLPMTEQAAIVFTQPTPFGPLPEFHYPKVSAPLRWTVGWALRNASGVCYNDFEACVAIRSNARPVGYIYVQSYDKQYGPLDLKVLPTMGVYASRALADLVEEPCEILGNDPRMVRVRESVAVQALVDTPVLVEGDLGTGKELVARAIHRLSQRHTDLFLWDQYIAGVHSQAILLFGREQTGASGQRRCDPGLIEKAAGGTLFIGGVDEIDLAVQRELLRFLQEGTVQRVGGNTRVPVDTRLIFGTRVSLEDAVSSGRFLEDLYIRIAATRIVLPKLSDRREDIPLLAAEFVRQLSWQRHVEGISAEAISFLQRQPWTGGVTRLKAVIRRAIDSSKSEILELNNFRAWWSD